MIPLKYIPRHGSGDRTLLRLSYGVRLGVLYLKYRGDYTQVMLLYLL